MITLRKILKIFPTVLVLFGVGISLFGCIAENPATLTEPDPPGTGTLSPDPFSDPNAVFPGCVLNFTAEISLAVDSAKTDVPHRRLQGAYTIPIRLMLPDQLLLRAKEFPKILFPLSAAETGVGFDVDVVIDAGGSADSTVARGVLSSDGSLVIRDLNLRVRFFTAGQGSLASDTDPGVLNLTLPGVDFGTSLVTADLGNGAPLQATGFPLQPDLSLKWVMAATVPDEPQLAGSIGGGNVAAEFEGVLDKNPQDDICRKGQVGPDTVLTGPHPHLEIHQVVAGIESPLSLTTVDFGTVQVGGGRSSSLSLLLKNTGNADLALQGFKFFDATAPFEITTPAAASLPPGGMAPLNIRFLPTIPVTGSPKRFETTLFINSNDPLQPARGLLLTGIGKPPIGEFQIVVKNPEEIDPAEVDFGSVFFPSAAFPIHPVLKSFRILNVGSADLKVAALGPLLGDFSIGLVRYGVNTTVLCSSAQNPLNPAHNCSINAAKKLMSSDPSEREVLTLPPRSPVHLDAVVIYFPVDFVSPDEASFVVHPQVGASRQITLTGETESNPAALLRVYLDKTPGGGGNDDLLIKSDTQFSFGGVSEVDLKIQNGGAAGGDRLKIRNEDITISGGGGRFTFTPATPGDPPFLEAPENLNDGRVLFGRLHHAPFVGVDTATLQIVGHSVDEDGNERPGDITYTTDLVAGVYDGEIVFKATRMMAGINNPALISKPSVSDVDARIQMVLDPNNEGRVQLKKILSRIPTAAELPGYRAMNNAGRLAFMRTIAPLRLATTSLGNGKEPPNCNEGDFNGVLGSDECSYFLVSIAGSSSNFDDPNAVKDSDPALSDYEIHPSEGSATLIFRDLTVRLLNPEHLLVASIGTFDEKLRISFSTGKIDPSLIFFSPSAAWSPPLDLVGGSGVNLPPLQVYIDQNDNSDGIPGNRRGILAGRDVHFATGHAVLAAVGKFSNSAPFFVQGAEMYIIIEGDFCGGNSGRSCD